MGCADRDGVTGCLCQHQAVTPYSWSFKDLSVGVLAPGHCPGFLSSGVLDPCPHHFEHPSWQQKQQHFPFPPLIPARPCFGMQETKTSIKSFWSADDMMGLFPSLHSYCTGSPCQLTQEIKPPQLPPSTLPGNPGVTMALLDPTRLSPSL